MNKEIAVIIEHTDGIISQQGLDAAAFALSLGSMYGWGVKAIILSNDIGSAEKLTGNLSMDSEILVCMELEKYSAEAYTRVLSSHLKKCPPSYMVIPHTSRGYDYAPALAVKLDIPCITAVTGLNDNQGSPVFLRLTAGGRIESQVPAKLMGTTMDMSGAFSRFCASMTLSSRSFLISVISAIRIISPSQM